MNTRIEAVPLRFPEWRELQPREPVRQGDILTSVAAAADPWHRHLVILTADCDLANSKHAGALTCVPVITLEQYVMLFRFERMRSSLANRMCDAARRIYAKTADSREINPARFRDWVLEDDAFTISKTLGLEGKEAQAFTGLCSAAANLMRAEPEDLRQVIEVLASAKVALGDATDLERASSSIAADLSGLVKDMPGDALFLNELSPAHSNGYVAYLRRVIEIYDREVARTVSQIASEARYVRIGRLRSPYVYALSQQFASVFSAIGLPPEYEHARERTRDRIKNGEY